MPKLTFIELCFWLYVAQNVVSGVLYHQVGGDLVLKPEKSTVPDPITSILWKHGKNKVAEWDKDFGGLDIYAAFKERTTLDQTTGELRISGLMKTDSGVYSMEFNRKLLDKTYTLSVIKAVPKPTITSSCNPDKTSCTLTCEGNTTDAEPVTYSWKVGEGPWEVLDKQHNVCKSNTGKSTNSYKYICKLNNAVSGEGEVSEPVGEVFGPVLYHQVGGDLVLKPEKSTVPDPITSILWKHGKNKVSEWDKDFGGLDVYAAFKERTTLNQTIGELRISGLMKTDSGVYSVEFNRKLLDKTYTLSVINVVPKPKITSSCNPDKTSCILTCEGDTTDAEPVTYSWKVGEGPWEVLDKQLFVSKSNTGKSNSRYNYICKLKNAVSGEVSEPVGEVFGSVLYHQVGGDLVLKPEKSTVPDPITSILWKHGKNKVAEWDKDFGGLDIYAAFKERTTLDQTTGELRISGLMKTDSGVYSMEFNRKLLDKTYTLSVIKAVPKPTITSSCNPDKTSCTLTCEGNTTDAEPVTYSWKVGEGPWEVLDKQHNVCKSNTGKSTNSYKYICKLNNAVSGEGEVSEPVGEVFGPEGNHEEELGVGKGEADEAAEKT